MPIVAGPSSEKTSPQETPLAPPPSLPPETPSSTHQPKSEPLKVKCVKCGSLDALPVRTLSRLTTGAENGRREMLKVILDGTCVRDIPLCSGCFMHAKGCFAFRSRLHMVKRLTWSTKTNEDAIQIEECFRCFDTEFARHVQRLKDADELINYVRGLEKPSTVKLPLPDSLGFEQAIYYRMPNFDPTAHLRLTGSDTTLFDGNLNTYEKYRERLLKERSPQRSCPTPPKDYPVQIPDLLALKKASESYVAALGRTGEASEQRRRITQLQNGLLDDFMRLPPIRYSQGQAATNAAVSDPTPIYCGICEWCRTILARSSSRGLAFSDGESV